MANENFTRALVHPPTQAPADPAAATRPQRPPHGAILGARPVVVRVAARPTVAHTLGAALVGFVAALSASAVAGDDGGRKHCTSTANSAFQACEHEIADDFHNAQAICTNESDENDREECFDEADDARREGNRDCRDIKGARRDLCRMVGEGRYDPDFDEEDFDDDFGDLTNPNPYFPLEIGNIQYFEGDETIVIEVKAATKLVDDVTCVVVNDIVYEDGLLVEDTDDWFAQAKNGDVWYCGEEAKDYEFFEGDDPQIAELVSIDGSFKAGRDGDKAGIQMRRMPRVGEVYRQEFSINNAEDVAEVLSVTYKYGVNADLDQHVPADLANLLCSAGDCLVIHEFSPLSPGDSGRKFYAVGIGFFLEVSPNSGESAQLVDCNYDDRCEDLPEP